MLVILQFCEAPNLSSDFKTFQGNKNIFFLFQSGEREHCDAMRAVREINVNHVNFRKIEITQQ